MKTLTFIFTSFVSFSLLASAAEFIQVREESPIKNAKEFEFLHCEPIQNGEQRLAVHYLVKMDNFEAKKLYITSALGGTKARELKNLALVAEELSSAEDENQDLGFSSGQMWLRFSLTIMDSDGQYLEGTVFDKSQQVPIKCRDITLE